MRVLDPTTTDMEAMSFAYRRGNFATIFDRYDDHLQAGIHHSCLLYLYGLQGDALYSPRSTRVVDPPS